MLVVKLDHQAKRSWLNSIAGGVRSETAPILDECGQKLTELAAVYFTRLSRGGTGYSGRHWAKPRPSTVRRRKALAARGLLRAPVELQGVLTGELQASLGYEVGGTRLKLRYAAEHARWFNIHRRLIPSRLPTEWRTACDAIVTRRLISLVTKTPQ
ncbi:hypothetical protein [Schlesneria sp. DSM 10557]|uniref:hypothetical protein n=1 Tax=Schlesneria sp. DSM 10557 TaxID=3044399 RepID=UPI0035A0E1C4